jgi:hypothetical protein
MASARTSSTVTGPERCEVRLVRAVSYRMSKAALLANTRVWVVAAVQIGAEHHLEVAAVG